MKRVALEKGKKWGVGDVKHSGDVVDGSVQEGSPSSPPTKRDAENDHVRLAWPDDPGARARQHLPSST